MSIAAIQTDRTLSVDTFYRVIVETDPDVDFFTRNLKTMEITILMGTADLKTMEAMLR
jgi:hypothetical protein